MKNHRLLIMILFVCFAAFSISAQTTIDESVKAQSCSQDKAEKTQLIKEAEENKFKFRRIVISGNTYTRHRVFMDKMIFGEDNIFTLNSLNADVKSISKINAIYPINLENVKIELDRESKSVDVLFCIKEKKKK